jgi:hypothetical protein
MTERQSGLFEMQSEPPLITIDEAAEVLDTTVETIWMWVQFFDLPAHSIFNTEFSQDELEKWFDENSEGLISAPTWHKKMGKQVCNLDASYLFPVARGAGRMPEWAGHLLQGDFDAVPDPLVWEDGSMLALMFDGYELSMLLGLGHCGKFANNIHRQANVSGQWSGSAIELWLCIFFEDRRWRHFGESPEGDDLQELDVLCSAFRRTLISENARMQLAVVPGSL